MKTLIATLISLFAVQCLAAGTLVLQLQPLKSRPCSKLSYGQGGRSDLLPQRSWNEDAPALKVLIESSSQTNDQLNSLSQCAAKVRGKLPDEFIAEDPYGASGSFKRALQECVSASSPDLEIFFVRLQVSGPCGDSP